MVSVGIPSPPAGSRWIALEFFQREPGELTWMHAGLTVVPGIGSGCLYGCERVEVRRKLSATADVMARLRIGERTSPFSNVRPVAEYPLAP